MRFFFAFIVLILLSACGASVHTDNRTRVALPKSCSIKTVTETVKTDIPVPVYKVQSVITTKTQSFNSDGTPAAPLHRSEVIQPDSADKK